MKVFVVTMYRYGDHEKHSYVLGVWSDREVAMSNGIIEEAYRGGHKYKAEVSTFIVDDNEYQKGFEDERET